MYFSYLASARSVARVDYGPYFLEKTGENLNRGARQIAGITKAEGGIGPRDLILEEAEIRKIKTVRQTPACTQAPI